MSKCHISFDLFNSADIADFIRLSEVEYGNLSTVTSYPHIDWKHLATPFGPSTAVNLKDGDKIVGRVILQPKTFYINGEERRIAFVTDALVHPDYRRPANNFLTLITSIREVKKFDVIFHTSNKRTENIYSKILKISCPFFLQGFGLPLRLTKLISAKGKIVNLCSKLLNIPYEFSLNIFLRFSKLFNEIEISASEPSEEVFDKFCHSENLKNNFLTTRNKKILKWRFLDAPLWKADILHFYHGEKYCGYVVLRQLELNGLNFSVIMDFVISSELSKIQKFCLRSLLINEARKNKADVIFTLLNPKSSSAKEFLGFPFIRVPDRFLPHTTPIFVHALDPKLGAIAQEQKLHITLGDLDYF